MATGSMCTVLMIGLARYVLYERLCVLVRSADDLSDWRYEGVIYRKDQDPKNRLGIRLLFAPDVARGADGKYYLYYAFDFMGIMGVAVSDSPAGPFEFYGHVQYADGTVWGRKKGDSFPFDPGIFVDDDGRVYLYSGILHPGTGDRDRLSQVRVQGRICT